MAGLGFTVTGGAEIRHALDTLEHDVSDLSEPFGTIISAAQQIFAKRFEQSGPGWAPLSPLYAQWKALHASGKPILVLSGHLRDSLTGGEGWSEHITPLHLEAGSTIAYGVYHQEGTGRMPARPPVKLEDTDLQQFESYITAHLHKVAAKTGLAVSG